MKNLATVAAVLGLFAQTSFAEEASQTDINADTAVVIDVTGDARKGKRVFKKCKACHEVKPDRHKAGPTLYGVMGRAAGSVEGFRYSKAIAESGLVWDVETFSAFMLDPRGTIPGNKMSFSGLKKTTEIEDLIAYLVEESVE